MRYFMIIMLVLNGFLSAIVFDMALMGERGTSFYVLDRLIHGCTTDADCGCTDDCLEMAQMEETT